MGLLSEFPFPRWAADQGYRASPAPNKPGYAAPGTGIHPLLLVGIQGVRRGGRSRRHCLRHSVDIFGPVWSSPIPASGDYVDPIYRSFRLT